MILIIAYIKIAFQRHATCTAKARLMAGGASKRCPVIVGGILRKYIQGILYLVGQCEACQSWAKQVPQTLTLNSEFWLARAGVVSLWRAARVASTSKPIGNYPKFK